MQGQHLGADLILLPATAKAAVVRDQAPINSRSARVSIGLVLLICAVSVAGCEDQSAAYKRGFAEGSQQSAQAAFEKGRQEGYSQGFEAARPGEALELSPMASGLYRALVLAGLLKLLLSLFFAAISLLFHSGDGTEVLGKSVLGVFGGVVAVVGVIFMGASSAVVEVLLAPGGSVGERLVTVLVSSLGMYLVLDVLFRIASSSFHRPWLEAWSLAIIVAFLSLLTPAAYFFWDRVPNSTDYSGANLFLGALLGALFWISRAALSGKFKGAPPQRPQRQSK
jgi:hypothetical protein